MELKSHISINKPVHEKKTVKEKREKTSELTNTNRDEKMKKNLEKEIENLEEGLRLLEMEIEKYKNDYQKLNSVYNEKVEIQKKIDKLLEEYIK